VLTDLPGFKLETNLAPDPRPGIAAQASYLSLRRLTTPGGLQAEIASSEQATLSDSSNPLSLTSFVATTALNGNQFTNSYSALSRTFSLGSPEGRQLTLQANALGRLSNIKEGSLAAKTLSYDAFGHLVNATDGTGVDSRTATFSYDAKGYVNLLHAADGRESQITNDVFGRPISINLPGDRTLGLVYGVDGRVESVTPPSRPAYTFQYDIASGRTTYRTPLLTGVDNTTILEQGVDRQFKSLTLPGGRHLDIARRASGTIATATNTFGDTFTYTYNTVGQVSGITQQGGQTVALAYNGLDVSGITWSGSVTGSIARQFNNDLRISSEAVNGETPIPFGYDRDGLMISVGPLAVTWRSDVDLLASTTLGNVSTTYEYDAFGDVARTTATNASAPLLDIKETRDAGGRVISRTEDLP
jgi:YD repeat-containing protein